MLKGSALWISADETTDATGRAVANVLLAKLDCDQYHAPYLANCDFLDKCDSSTVARLINDTLRWLDFFTKDNLSKVMVTHSFYNRSETE